MHLENYWKQSLALKSLCKINWSHLPQDINRKVRWPFLVFISTTAILVRIFALIIFTWNHGDVHSYKSELQMEALPELGFWVLSSIGEQHLSKNDPPHMHVVARKNRLPQQLALVAGFFFFFLSFCHRLSPVLEYVSKYKACGGASLFWLSLSCLGWYSKCEYYVCTFFVFVCKSTK